jgi:hypothetical protein
MKKHFPLNSSSHPYTLDLLSQCDVASLGSWLDQKGGVKIPDLELLPDTQN